jgi:hypothetical protein
VPFDQRRWAYGNSRDLENGESGIAAQDELDEQLPFRDWQEWDGVMKTPATPEAAMRTFWL